VGFFVSSGVIVKVMMILLLWCSVDFRGCGLFMLIGFFRLLGWATSLVSCRFRGCGLFMLIGFLTSFLVGILLLLW
jgi:hypothetical protein